MQITLSLVGINTAVAITQLSKILVAQLVVQMIMEIMAVVTFYMGGSS